MLSVLLTILHVMICLFLIVVVLLQAGKGGGVGAAFGASGSGSMFGARGPATFLSKMTAAMAGLFMLTSVFLALSATRQDSKLGKKHGKKKKPVAAAGAVAGQAGSATDGGAAVPAVATTAAPDGAVVNVVDVDGGVSTIAVPPVPVVPPRGAASAPAGAGAGANVPREIKVPAPTPPAPPKLPPRPTAEPGETAPKRP